MSKSKTLSPKQKKIAAMAGDPNKIEGEDFQKLKTMKASDGRMTEMDLADIVNRNPDAFEAGDRASEKVLQDKVDKDAERFKTIKGAKEALKRAKIRKTSKDLASKVSKIASPIAIGAGTLGDIMGSLSGYMKKSGGDRLTSKDIEAAGMVSGGSVMSRGCKMGRNKKTKIY